MTHYRPAMLLAALVMASGCASTGRSVSRDYEPLIGFWKLQDTLSWYASSGGWTPSGSRDEHGQIVEDPEFTFIRFQAGGPRCPPTEGHVSLMPLGACFKPKAHVLLEHSNGKTTWAIKGDTLEIVTEGQGFDATERHDALRTKILFLRSTQAEAEEGNPRLVNR